MASYDDSDLIREIERTLMENPAITRRAAIIAVAGEGSLRRIEKKMAGAAKVDFDDSDLRIHLARFAELRGYTSSEIATGEATVTRVRSEGITVRSEAGALRNIPGDWPLSQGDRIFVYELPTDEVVAIRAGNGQVIHAVNARHHGLGMLLGIFAAFLLTAIWGVVATILKLESIYPVWALLLTSLPVLSFPIWLGLAYDIVRTRFELEIVSTLRTKNWVQPSVAAR